MYVYINVCIEFCLLYVLHTVFVCISIIYPLQLYSSALCIVCFFEIILFAHPLGVHLKYMKDIPVDTSPVGFSHDS